MRYPSEYIYELYEAVEAREDPICDPIFERVDGFKVWASALNPRHHLDQARQIAVLKDRNTMLAKALRETLHTLDEAGLERPQGVTASLLLGDRGAFDRAMSAMARMSRNLAHTYQPYAGVRTGR